MLKYDIQKIKQILPHRYPFLLVDRILELELGVRVVGLKNVTVNEPFFQGHFPQQPVMPGVLIVEAMAQTGGVLAYETILEAFPQALNQMIFFMGMDQVKFRKPVFPGDQLIMTVEAIKIKSRAVKMQGYAHVDGNLVAEAIVSAILSEVEAV